MGTSPAPELANDFAFWHEYGFLTHMVNEYKQYGPGRYPSEFISQYAGSAKRYIDDIITVSLDHTIGPTLQDIILQDGVFFGMYPTTVREFDGSVRPSPISIVREQIGPSVHFLDMEIIQPLPGICIESSLISRRLYRLDVSMLSYTVNYAASHIDVHRDSVSSKLRLDSSGIYIHMGIT